MSQNLLIGYMAAQLERDRIAALAERAALLDHRDPSHDPRSKAVGTIRRATGGALIRIGERIEGVCVIEPAARLASAGPE